MKFTCFMGFLRGDRHLGFFSRIDPILYISRESSVTLGCPGYNYYFNTPWHISHYTIPFTYWGRIQKITQQKSKYIHKKVLWSHVIVKWRHVTVWWRHHVTETKALSPILVPTIRACWSFRGLGERVISGNTMFSDINRWDSITPDVSAW